MPSLFKAILRTIQKNFRQPTLLYALLESHPDLSANIGEPTHDISAKSVTRWHEWGKTRFNSWPRRDCGEMQGWHYENGNYSSFYVKRVDFANFCVCEVTENWECDIQDITGLAASKSDLKSFDSLDRMVETNSRNMIEPTTIDKLHENLAWSEIRILNDDNSSDFFVRYRWDDRVFLINSGGSHHFAAARYIAARIGIPVPLRGRLHTWAINKIAVANLQRDYEIFVMSNTPTTALGFHGAMQHFRASYLWRYLPHPYLDCRAIFLPKSDARSAKVAAVLHEAEFFDLGLYLRELTVRQSHTPPLP